MNLLLTVRVNTSIDSSGKNLKNSTAPKNTGNTEEGEDNETGENNQNSGLITSTIEETECDWEYAHVIRLFHSCFTKTVIISLYLFH